MCSCKSSAVSAQRLADVANLVIFYLLRVVFAAVFFSCSSVNLALVVIMFGRGSKNCVASVVS